MQWRSFNNLILGKYHKITVIIKTCDWLDTAHISLQSKKLSIKLFGNRKEKMINSIDEVWKSLKDFS